MKGVTKMRKQLILSMLMLIMLTSFALAEVSLDIPATSGSVEQSDTFSETITITNDGDTVNLSFSASDLTGTGDDISDITILPSSVENLALDETVDVTITITVPNNQDAGEYTGTFTVDYDANGDAGSDTADITLDVTEKNLAPSISTSAVTAAFTNTQYTYDVDATDANGDSLTYILEEKPSGMTINSDTGVITWTPTATGSQAVTVNVTDGEFYDFQEWTIVVTSPDANLEFSDLDFGSSSQDRDIKDTINFNLQNTGAQALNQLVFTSTLSSDYELVLAPSTTTLNPGQTISVNAEITVPEDQTWERTKIGTITAEAQTDSSVTVTQTQDVYLETVSELDVKKVTIIIDGKKETVSEDETVDAKPGDVIELEIELENTFSDNIDLEDIEVTVEQDDDLDWDESDDISKIKDDDEEKITFDFDIPFDVDDDDAPFQVLITAEGDDENGATHYVEFEFEVDIDKERDELSIFDLRFSPSFVTCDANNVRLDVTLANTGRDDQEDGVLTVESDDLDFDYIARDLIIDEGDEINRRVSIPLPSNLREREYQFDVRVYTSSRDNDLTDIEVISLDVRNCDGSSSSGSSSSNNNNNNDNTNTNNNNDDDDDDSSTVIDVVPPQTTTSSNVVATSVGSPSKAFDSSSTAYIVLLAVVALLLLVLIVLLVGVAFKKK